MTDSTARTSSRLSALLAAALLLAGCAPEASQPQPAEPQPASAAVTVEDAWVKAAPDGMTAAFGILSSTADDELTVIAADTDAADGTELHETADDGSGTSVMREVGGGFAIPAQGALALEPGGNHLMLMGLTGPLRAGDEVRFTLTFSDDSTLSFTAPVKDFAGAEEEYGGTAEHGGH